MFNKIIKFNLIIFLFIQVSFADVVNNIVINGNERISKETIAVFGSFKVGDDLSTNDLNRILKDLYSTNFFNDVKISLNENILKIVVNENPIVQSIFLEGIKKKDVKEELLRTLTLKEKSSYVETLVEQDANNLKNILKQSGFYFVELTTKLKKNENNTVDIIYDINLGEKANIKNIIFTGDKKFKDRKLRNIITSEESKIWKFLSNRQYLDQNRIELDVRLLTNFYKNKGFYNAKISSFSAEFLDTNNFNLNFNIESGKRFFFNNLNLVLPTDYKETNFKDILKTMNDLKGSAYSLTKIEDILSEIDKIALSKQFEFISADIDEVIINDTSLDFNILIKETEKFYVERINILGNSVTEESVIRNVFLVDEGDAFNEILHNKTINTLKSKNLFKTVTTETIEGSSANQKVININVEEKPTGEISAGAGIGTSGGSIGFSVKENNYMGRGTKLNSSINIGKNSIRGAISMTVPNYKYSDNALTSSLSSLQTDNLSDYGYKSSKTGFSVGTFYEQYEDIYFSPSISSYVESLETDTKASSSLKKQEGNYFDANFDYGIVYDKRNQSFQPSDGFKSSFYQSVPLISENYSLINGYTFSTYHELLDDMIASISVYTRMITSLNDKDVRISDRLQIPSNRLRGFQTGKIGPIDGGDYVGGNYASAFNLSTTLPYILPSLQNVDFKIFFDAANVWGVDYDSSIDDGSKIRSSIGIGIDWLTAVGPLSFSLTEVITKQDTDVTESFRFNLGTTF